VAAKLSVDASINWVSLAAKTTHFSGADLQSLLYNSHLEAVHELLSEQSEQTTHKKQSDDSVQFCVTDGCGNEVNMTAAEKHQMKERVKDVAYLHVAPSCRTRIFEKAGIGQRFRKQGHTKGKSLNG
jgi:hypothetical protein